MQISNVLRDVCKGFASFGNKNTNDSKDIISSTDTEKNKKGGKQKKNKSTEKFSSSASNAVSTGNASNNKYKVEVVTIVGGMSEYKQRRLLLESKMFGGGSHKNTLIGGDGAMTPMIVVATPGRLCELLKDSQRIASLRDLSLLRFLVVDEADRIMEDGHFPEVRTNQ